jgi:hypothetical protein
MVEFHGPERLAECGFAKLRANDTEPNKVGSLGTSPLTRAFHLLKTNNFNSPTDRSFTIVESLCRG